MDGPDRQPTDYLICCYGCLDIRVCFARLSLCSRLSFLELESAAGTIAVAAMTTDSIPSKDGETADIKSALDDAPVKLPWDEQEERRLVRKIDARCLVRLACISWLSSSC